VIRKILKILGISLGVIIIGIIGFRYYALSDLCANTLITSSLSPDGKWSVVFFERNCGATTGFSSQVSLIQADEELENDAGNIYIAEGYPENYKIQWTSNTSVTVSGAKGHASLKEGMLNGVQFTYE